MITAIACCPNPPLLLPGATGGQVAEVEELRQACLDAMKLLLAAPSDVVVLLGTEQEQDEPHGELSLQVGRYLLAAASAPGGLAIAEESLPADLPPEDCAELGQRWAADERRLAILVMGDGSARRTEKAPGHFDERAAGFDEAVEAALRGADVQALAALDPQLATDLLVSGRPAWQVMAAAAAASSPQLGWRVVPQYFQAPFGVFYPVVNWLPQ